MCKEIDPAFWVNHTILLGSVLILKIMRELKGRYLLAKTMPISVPETIHEPNINLPSP